VAAGLVLAGRLLNSRGMPAHSAQDINPGSLTDQRAVRERLQWFTREKTWINDIHLQICRIPAPTFLEGERAAFLLSRFKELGWQASLDRAGNVVAWEGVAPFVAVTAHLDTVIAPKNKDQIAVEADGRITGPGVADNGAGLAALIAIASAWKTQADAAPFRSGLMLVANTAEEGEGNLAGMKHFIKEATGDRKVESVVVVDGANTDHITTRGLGSQRFEISFAGPGGHSWSDYGLCNPLHALCRAVSIFSDTQINAEPRSSFNVGLIEGGLSVNAIPNSARAKVDIRSESNERIEELVRALSAALDRAREIENQRARTGKLTARMKEIGSRPAAALSENAFILRALRAVDAHLGIRSHVECSSTDANVPLSAGIPALAIGGGGAGGGAHSVQEWFRPDGRDLGLKRVMLLTMLLMQGPGTLRDSSAQGGGIR
jgi:tripeptide aminopeptidase